MAFWGRDWGSPGQPTCYAHVPSFHGAGSGGSGHGRSGRAVRRCAPCLPLAGAPVSSARAGLSPGSPDEASLEPEPEDKVGGAQGSMAGMGQRRANTTMHVCWCRHTSVSRADHSAAVEVRPGAPALLPPYSSTQLASAPLSMQPGLSGLWARPQSRWGPGRGASRRRAAHGDLPDRW